MTDWDIARRRLLKLAAQWDSEGFDSAQYATELRNVITTAAPPTLSDAAADRENLIDMLQSVEWVRQAAGKNYACPFCHGITERDGGPGHAADCRWYRVMTKG